MIQAKIALLPKRNISGSRKEGNKTSYTMTAKHRCMMITHTGIQPLRERGLYFEATGTKNRVYKA